MKKTIIIVSILALCAICALGFLLGRGDRSDLAELELPEPTAPPAGATAIDYETLYARYPLDMVVVRAEDGEMSWGDYFYLLYSQTRQVTDYFSSMAMYYGLQEGWSDIVEGEDITYAQLAMESLDSIAQQFMTIESFARDNRVELTPENERTLAEQHQQDLVNFCGEGATEADFDAYLSGIYMTRGMYERVERINLIYQENFTQVYGEDGCKYSDADTRRFLEEGGYLAAHHILLLNSDEMTGEALSEEEIARNRQTLTDLAEELRAIEDPRERLARFSEMKEQLCQDGGRFEYPDGYTFTPGTMVTEFEQALNGLGEYEVSDPVESDYGFHLIMRLPLGPENLVFGDTARTARAVAANADYGLRLQEKLDAGTLSYAPGFEGVDLLRYLIIPDSK